MHTVALTHVFERAAADAGMSENDIQVLVDFLAENPTAGDVMVGTGGCRKVRVAGRGKGKRGGYRTITFYTGENLPVFLITVFGKGEKSNLSKSGVTAFGTSRKAIEAEYRSRVAALARRGA